jgi:hypothetical protein
VAITPRIGSTPEGTAFFETSRSSVQIPLP